MLLDIFRVTPKSRKIKLRKRKGVLFSNPGLAGKTMFYFGTVLLMGALGYGVYLYYPLSKALINYWSYKQTAVIPVQPPLAIPTPTIVAQNTNEYSISVPKIMAFAPIVENVSPYDSKEYLKVLKNNVVAQAKDTSPIDLGNGHTTYMFAHSSAEGIGMVRNNTVFYLLGELTNSDVIFINRYGKIYTYQVYNQKIVNADQIQYMKYSEPDKEVLILQTCWPIGTDWKRLLVFAKRIK